ncbi:MAG: hypothetical protein J4428_01535 [Candidatus Aenigmarchaeota archaeon]|nr:hypothetical protein [Candidatus Aenigmarchaeota archaeon]
MEKYNLIRFAVKFSLITAILLVIFHFTFPYYRLALNYTIGVFSHITNLQISSRIILTFMPYVSLSALILATPKKTVKEKIKFVVLIFALFYLIDISFAIIQILLQNTPIKYYHVLVVQNFFTISLPIIFWFVFDRSDI